MSDNAPRSPHLCVFVRIHAVVSDRGVVLDLDTYKRSLTLRCSMALN